MEQLPVPAPKFTGESRVVDANRIFAWLQRGWLLFVAEPARSRSEERRVGKECRSRWSPYH